MCRDWPPVGETTCPHRLEGARILTLGPRLRAGTPQARWMLLAGQCNPESAIARTESELSVQHWWCADRLRMIRTRTVANRSWCAVPATSWLASPTTRPDSRSRRTGRGDLGWRRRLPMPSRSRSGGVRSRKPARGATIAGRPERPDRIWAEVLAASDHHIDLAEALSGGRIRARRVPRPDTPATRHHVGAAAGTAAPIEHDGRSAGNWRDDRCVRETVGAGTPHPSSRELIC